MINKSKQLIKTTLVYISFFLIVFIYCLKPLFLFVNYLFRACYSQYKRFELKKSDNSLIIVYPILLKGGKYIQLGRNVFLGAGGILSAWGYYCGIHYSPQIIIGNDVTIGNGFHISAINKIVIGNHVLIGKYVTIVDNAHGKIEYNELKFPPKQRELLQLGEVIIEDNVWIADKVTIAKGVKIGKGAIIGANSVVTMDVPSYSVAVGCPARLVKQFNKDYNE